jgi:hypothetical protein
MGRAGSWDGRRAPSRVVLGNGLIDAAGTGYSKNWGIYLDDEGSDSTTVAGVVLGNQSFAAIGVYMNVGTSLFEGNDYSGILSSAKPISYAHWSSPTP